MEELKQCINCLQTLNYDKFHKKSSSPDGRNNICKDCINERKQEYKSNDIKHLESLTEGTIPDDLESLTVSQLKNIMRVNNILIKRMNKADIIQALKQFAECGIREVKIKHVPTKNIRNSPRRVKISGEHELIFLSISAAAKFLNCNNNEILYKSNIGSYKIEIIDPPLE